MFGNTLLEDVYRAMADVPVIDIHTHLVGGKLGARGLHDILLYHMGVSDLYAAGCPTGSRLTEYPGWTDEAEAHGRIEEALPFLPLVQNTSTSWTIRHILADLYDWQDEITVDNWRTLDAMIRERADDRAWHRTILDRVNIRRVGAEWARREGGIDDDLFQYSLEWVFFARCRWGEFDTALCELESAWGKKPGPATPIGSGPRPPVERRITSIDDIHEAVHEYVRNIAETGVLTTAAHLSTDLDLRAVDDDKMAAALRNRSRATEAERSIYASYIQEAFLSSLEAYAPHVAFQFSFAAEPLPHETGSRLYQRTLVQLAEIVHRHPGLRFQCFVASASANQSLCTLCRELPNLSLAGFWWHNFFPSIIRQVFEERLDMLPVNKHIAFFSDAYCVEWTYGKAHTARHALAEVFARKIRTGQYSLPTAIDIARSILFETPQTLLGFQPMPLIKE
ncbi:MAG: hypothetical protein AMXMBFR84_30180 [Candidatus Hydrogenedentota bacterium]